MEFQVLTTEPEVLAVVEEWRQLARELPQATPFGQPSWVLPWWRQRREENISWLCFAMREDGELSGLLPLVRCVDTVIRFAGYDLCDAVGAVTRPDSIANLWQFAVDWMRGQLAPAVVDLPVLAAHDRVSLGFMGREASDVDMDPGAVINLPSTWEDYLAHFSAKRRKGWQYELRRMERDLGRPDFEVTTDSSLLRQHLHAFWELRERSWTQQGRYAELADHVRGIRLLDFLNALADAAPEDPSTARVARLLVTGRLAATAVLLKTGPRIWVPMTTYDPELARYRPGYHLLLRCVRHAIGESCAALEMGRGVEQYKFDLGAHRYELTNTVLTIGQTPLRQAEADLFDC